ncbi:MAG: VOC family protein [Trueperaceae bacterium]
MDLTVPDVKRAAKFYADVFGWDYAVSGPELGHYHQAKVDGGVVAGLGQPMGGEATPAVWTIYFAADDVDAMTTHAKDLGGNVLVPVMEVPGQGRMSIVSDPTGAAFGLWQAIAHEGFGIDDVAGALTWVEVTTPDAHAAKAFYQALLDADAEPFDRPGTTYLSLQKDGEWIGGILQMTDETQGMPAHWMPYIRVDDADAVIAAIQAGGGAVAHGPFDTSFGRVAVAADPFGAHFSVLQPPAE